MKILAYILNKFSKSKSPSKESILKNEEDDLSLMIIPDSAVNFGYKNLWIAVRTRDKDKVANLLGMKSIMACNWKYGIEKAYENHIFITPSIGEWTLIVGWGLANLSSKSYLEEIRGFKEKLNTLSKEFGESQFFLTHRITEYHSWAKSINGKVVRYYSYVGEQLENILIEGEPTQFENRLNLVNTFSEEAKEENYFERLDITFPDEEQVMLIAENWSVNPTALEQRKDIIGGLGLVGKSNYR